MWGHSSPTGDPTHTPSNGSLESSQDSQRSPCIYFKTNCLSVVYVTNDFSQILDSFQFIIRERIAGFFFFFLEYILKLFLLNSSSSK